MEPGFRWAPTSFINKGRTALAFSSTALGIIKEDLDDGQKSFAERLMNGEPYTITIPAILTDDGLELYIHTWRIMPPRSSVLAIDRIIIISADTDLPQAFYKVFNDSMVEADNYQTGWGLLIIRSAMRDRVHELGVLVRIFWRSHNCQIPV